MSAKVDTEALPQEPKDPVIPDPTPSDEFSSNDNQAKKLRTQTITTLLLPGKSWEDCMDVSMMYSYSAIPHSVVTHFSLPIALSCPSPGGGCGSIC